MKILHLNSSWTGGSGIAARRLHFGLLKRGISSKMLIKGNTAANSNSVFRANSHTSYFKRKLLNVGLLRQRHIVNRNIIERLKGNFEIFSFAKTDYNLQRHPLVTEADIIHLHWVSNYIDYPTFFKKIDKPIIWTLHDMNPFQGGFHYNEDTILNPQFRRVDEEQYRVKKSGIKYAKQLTVVTLCEWMKTQSSHSELLGDRPHYLIRNGISPEEFTWKDKEAARKELGFSDQKPIFSFISENLSIRRKGFDILIEALKTITTDVRLVAIGNNDNDETDLDINYTGFLHDSASINTYLSASDAFLLPSREDNLPNAMLESLLSGTPVIAFNIGGMPDVLENDFNGILVDNISPESFSKAIMYFLKNKAKFHSEKIATNAKELFDIDKVVDQYVSLYSEILA